jgi:amidase
MAFQGPAAAVQAAPVVPPPRIEPVPAANPEVTASAMNSDSIPKSEPAPEAAISAAPAETPVLEAEALEAEEPVPAVVEAIVPVSADVDTAAAEPSAAAEEEPSSMTEPHIAAPADSVPATRPEEPAPELAEPETESAVAAPVVTEAPAILEAAPSDAAPSGDDIVKLGALDIARLVKARCLSPVTVVEAHLAAIERTNPTVNAVCTLAADHALETARRQESDIAAGRAVGPLAGVPVGIKDITPTAGIRTTYGSTLYADNVPTEDALVVQRLKAAGAIVIGKTNTPEFAAGANTYNAVFGATRNPWNPALSASGSTGGGAAGLRCGMFALAEGSDFGGSLRTPAAFCGVVGLRPSPGLVPKYPSSSPWDVLSVAGPMARSVPDLAAMLQAISGPSPYSPLIVPTDGRDFVAAAGRGIKPGLRVAYCPDTARIGVDTEIERMCREAAFALEAAGASVQEIDLDLSVGRQAFLQLRGQSQLGRHLDRLGKIDKLGANLAGNIRFGLAQSPRDVAMGERGQAQIFEIFRKFFESYDCLITPCTAVPPFPVERNYPETINGQPMKTYIDWVAPTFVVTLAGLPAASVPCGFTAANLPVGLQIVGPRWGEELTLAVAKVVEDAHPVGFPEIG